MNQATAGMLQTDLTILGMFQFRLHRCDTLAAPGLGWVFVEALALHTSRKEECQAHLNHALREVNQPQYH